jgi:putative acetyltransferase
MMIRREMPDDIQSIYKVNKAAFSRENEGKLVNAIRESEHFIPELSLVAEENGEVIGYILFSKIFIKQDGELTEAIALAPMAVQPEFQGKGVGSALVKEGLVKCKQLGYPLVIVLGHPEFYPRFGFEKASDKGIVPPFPVPDEVFMVCELKEGAADKMKGEVVYPPSFQEV